MIANASKQCRSPASCSLSQPSLPCSLVFAGRSILADLHAQRSKNNDGELSRVSWKVATPAVGNISPRVPKPMGRRRSQSTGGFVPVQDPLPLPGPESSRRNGAGLPLPMSTPVPELQTNPGIAGPLTSSVPTIPANRGGGLPASFHSQDCQCGCQPLCATTTILVPVWDTYYQTTNQTRYRTESSTAALFCL